MKRTKSVHDSDFYIDEYMYNCQRRRKTLQFYDMMGITSPEEIQKATFRRYSYDYLGNEGISTHSF